MSAFNLNPSSTSYDPINAYWLGRAAKLAYDNPATIQQETAKWGFDQFQFFDNQDTQAFLIANAQTAILAFRGTEPSRIKDWMSDADVDLVDCLGGKAHHGFVRALERVWTQVEAALPGFQSKGQTLWVTGHSLGAALACLATARLRLQDKKPVSGLYTFGQPRTGNRTFANIFDQDFKARTFRFVNNNDAVPRVPLPGLIFQYTHVGTLLYFDESGGLHPDMPWWKKLLDSVKGRVADLLKPGTDGIKDHSMDEYVKNLEKNVGFTPRL